MAWEKRGFIFKPSGEAGWINSHAQVPNALLMEDRIRVYIAVRPEQTKSLTTFVDLDIADPTKVLYVHDKPVLELGAPGHFDAFGIMPNCIMRVGDEVWLYYNGWNRAPSIPMYNAIGLAISKDGGKTFSRAYPGPIMAAHKEEPFSALGPRILREGKHWHMWYSATMDWRQINNSWEQTYTLFYAHSENGVDWVRPHHACIPSATPGECTVCPAVVKDGDTYRMWFAKRNNTDYRGGSGSYSIGYAESKDKLNWARDDSKAGIAPSESGWDAVMIANPCIIDTPHGRYMFYDGNRFGQDGFGYAVWKD